MSKNYTLKKEPSVSRLHIVDFIVYASDPNTVQMRQVCAETRKGWPVYEREITPAEYRTYLGKLRKEFAGEPRDKDWAYVDNARNRKAEQVGEVWKSRVRFSRNYA